MKMSATSEPAEFCSPFSQFAPSACVREPCDAKAKGDVCASREREEIKSSGRIENGAEEGLSGSKTRGERERDNNACVKDRKSPTTADRKTTDHQSVRMATFSLTPAGKDTDGKVELGKIKQGQMAVQHGSPTEDDSLRLPELYGKSSGDNSAISSKHSANIVAPQIAMMKCTGEEDRRKKRSGSKSEDKGERKKRKKTKEDRHREVTSEGEGSRDDTNGGLKCTRIEKKQPDGHSGECAPRLEEAHLKKQESESGSECRESCEKRMKEKHRKRHRRDGRQKVKEEKRKHGRSRVKAAEQLSFSPEAESEKSFPPSEHTSTKKSELEKRRQRDSSAGQPLSESFSSPEISASEGKTTPDLLSMQQKNPESKDLSSGADSSVCLSAGVTRASTAPPKKTSAPAASQSERQTATAGGEGSSVSTVPAASTTAAPTEEAGETSDAMSLECSSMELISSDSENMSCDESSPPASLASAAAAVGSTSCTAAAAPPPIASVHEGERKGGTAFAESSGNSSSLHRNQVEQQQMFVPGKSAAAGGSSGKHKRKPTSNHQSTTTSSSSREGEVSSDLQHCGSSPAAVHETLAKEVSHVHTPKESGVSEHASAARVELVTTTTAAAPPPPPQTSVLSVPESRTKSSAKKHKLHQKIDNSNDESARSSSRRRSSGHQERNEDSSSVHHAAQSDTLEAQLLALQQEIAEQNRLRRLQQEKDFKETYCRRESLAPGDGSQQQEQHLMDLLAETESSDSDSKSEQDEEEEEEDEIEVDADETVGEAIEELERQQVKVELVKAEQWPSAAGGEPVSEEVKLPDAVQTLEECEKCLHPTILNNLRRCGFKRLLLIQKFAFPLAGAGYDLCGAAQTGSGKTLAFVTPLLSKLLHFGNVIRPFFPGPYAQASPLGLILVPTRELALQIGYEIERLTKHSELSHMVFAGGCTAKEQAAEINQRQVDVAVCTPGRLEDLCAMCKICLEFVQVLVLDEADAMLDMGFRDKILSLVNDRDLPRERQTLLFFATSAPELKRLIPTLLKFPFVRLTVGTASVTGQAWAANMPQGLIKQVVKMVERERKLATLYEDLESFFNSVMGSNSSQQQHKQTQQLHLQNPGCSSFQQQASHQQQKQPDPPPPTTTTTTTTNITTSVTTTTTPLAINSMKPQQEQTLQPDQASLVQPQPEKEHLQQTQLVGASSNASGLLSPAVNQAIVFVNSKRTVYPVTNNLRLKGFSVDSLSSNLSREARKQVFSAFKQRKFAVLVATSVAARGLDFPYVKLVVNFDLPQQTETYLHRIGRTGRLGRTGLAISYFSAQDRPFAPALLDILQKTNQTIPPFLLSFANDRRRRR